MQGIPPLRTSLRLLPRVLRLLLPLLLLAGPAHAQPDGGWRPAEGPLRTRWADDVSPDRVHPEYPRPQLVRPAWLSLNGLWEYRLQGRDMPRPDRFDGRILVPFPVESALSGVMERAGGDSRLWYRRTFEVPRDWAGQRLLLHFGAVDWEADVWVNGTPVGSHRGGYTPFTFDVTDALREGGPQELVVAVWDPTDAGPQPRGKQVTRPEGIWYTPVTGIWGSVWLEPVPEAYLAGLRLEPDLDAGALHLHVRQEGRPGTYWIEAVARDGDRPVATARGPAGRPLVLPLDSPRRWTPDDPFLYDLTVRLLYREDVVDEVASYFGMREIAVGPDAHGVQRLLLNDEPVFQYGLLDQGYWPDGLYTAPTDEALRYDLEMTKRLGFNMVRKHAKVEPARWYYWCDRLGLLVWQDMPSGDRATRDGEVEITRTEVSARGFERELKAMIDALYNHPSIVMWVLFNEGWGQYDTAALTAWLDRYDPTRLVNSASGWHDRGVGDVLDVHRYPGPDAAPPEPDRAVVLGEFGGLGLPLRGHTWQDDANWGYQSFTSSEALTGAYLRLLRHLRPLIHGSGLSAAVYTQTTDVEIEVNGLLTYDREALKLDADRLREAHRTLYRTLESPPPRVHTVLPSASAEGRTWRFTLTRPQETWIRPGFDDRRWRAGTAGFGRLEPGAPGAVRTPWTTPDIWLRRAFEVDAATLQNPHLRIYHDGEATVYLNGRRVAEVPGYTQGYVLIPFDEAARDALQPGRNVLAVHAHNGGGGQFIDVGIVDLR